MLKFGSLSLKFANGYPRGGYYLIGDNPVFTSFDILNLLNKYTLVKVGYIEDGGSKYKAVRFYECIDYDYTVRNITCKITRGFNIFKYLKFSNVNEVEIDRSRLENGKFFKAIIAFNNNIKFENYTQYDLSKMCSSPKITRKELINKFEPYLQKKHQMENDRIIMN